MWAGIQNIIAVAAFAAWLQSRRKGSLKRLKKVAARRVLFKKRAAK